MNKLWLAALAVLVAVGIAVFVGSGLILERKTPAQRQAEEDLRARCEAARDVTQRSLTRYQAGSREPLVEAARVVNALGADETRCSGAARDEFESARSEIERLMRDAEWFVLNSEIEIETLSALVAGWGKPEDREAWQRRRETLAAALAEARPATLDIFATEDGEPTCREDTLRQSEAQRIGFRRAILEGASALYPERPIVMGRLAEERIAAGITPLSIDADFQFELFADARPGTGMRIWIPGRLVMRFTDDDDPPLTFSAEREVPENITTTIWKCDWDQAEQLLEDLLATLGSGPFS